MLTDYLKVGEHYKMLPRQGGEFGVTYMGKDETENIYSYKFSVDGEMQFQWLSEEFVEDYIYFFPGRQYESEEKHEEKKEMVNHPDHYAGHGIETIEKMIRIWGKEKVALWCEITAFKYRDRIGYKDDVQQECAKILWYENKAKELLNKDKK